MGRRGAPELSHRVVGQKDSGTQKDEGEGGKQLGLEASHLMEDPF